MDANLPRWLLLVTVTVILGSVVVLLQALLTGIVTTGVGWAHLVLDLLIGTGALYFLFAPQQTSTPAPSVE